MKLLLLVALVAIAIFWGFVAFVVWLWRRRHRETLYTEDRPGFSTYVSFRPLDMSRGSWHATERPFFSVFTEKLTHHKVHLNAISGVGHAHRATVTWGGLQFQMTMGRVQELPELWLLTVDQRFRNGLSAPHDTPEVREFLSLLRQIMLELEIGTVRWHTRQDWERGQVDNYTYKPC